jgi:DNA gyrase subunit A
MVVTVSHKGYIKRVPLTTYGVQHRGGRGKMGLVGLDDSGDVMQDVFAARNHDELLFFTNFGRVYSKTVFQIPEGSRIAKGRAIVNILPLQDGEHVVRLLSTRDLHEQKLVMLSKYGVIKRTQATAFMKIRSTGIRAVTLRESDELVFCGLSSGSDSILVATVYGQGIRFEESEVRVMGRQAAGVRAIRLKKNDYVAGMEIISDDEHILFATEYGYGKQVRATDFRTAHRGGSGVRTIPTTKRNGNVIGLCIVDAESSVLLIDTTGKIIRLSPKEIRTMGRQAKGVRLIRLNDGQKLSSIVSIPANPEEDDADGSKPDEQPVTPER